MWTTEYTSETDVPRSAVWAAIRALHSGEPLGPSSDRFELHGPFAVGTEITVTPEGQQPMRSVITEVEDGTVYADETQYGEIVLTFRHTLREATSGSTIVTHTLTIDGPGADEVGPELGPQISGDFPSAMSELFDAARAAVAKGPDAQVAAQVNAR